MNLLCIFFIFFIFVLRLKSWFHRYILFYFVRYLHCDPHFCSICRMWIFPKDFQCKTGSKCEWKLRKNCWTEKYYYLYLDFTFRLTKQPTHTQHIHFEMYTPLNIYQHKNCNLNIFPRSRARMFELCEFGFGILLFFNMANKYRAPYEKKNGTKQIHYQTLEFKALQAVSSIYRNANYVRKMCHIFRL